MQWVELPLSVHLLLLLVGPLQAKGLHELPEVLLEGVPGVSANFDVKTEYILNNDIDSSMGEKHLSSSRSSNNMKEELLSSSRSSKTVEEELLSSSRMVKEGESTVFECSSESK